MRLPAELKDLIFWTAILSFIVTWMISHANQWK